MGLVDIAYAKAQRKKKRKPVKVTPSTKAVFAGARPTTPSTSASRPSRRTSTSASSSSGRSTAKRRRILRKPYPGLDPEQTRTLETVLNQGRKAGATRKEMKSAVETGLVESGLRNLDYGDADSEGWRQERTSIYGTGKKGPTNVRASARRYFGETAAAGRGKGATAGQLAQAVQRSAHPERYDERRKEAGKLLRTYAKKAKASGDKKVFTKGPTKLKGPYAGSKSAIRQVIGKKTARTQDWKDKEPGHSPTGDHDPSQRSAYAADLPHDQTLLNRINKKLGTKLKLGQDATVNYKGYRVQVITSPHGTGPHIHIGARLGSGTPTTGGSAFGGGSAVSGTGGFAGTAIGRGQTAAQGASKRRRGRGQERRDLLQDILGRQVFEPTVPVKKAPRKPVRKKAPSKSVQLGL